MFKIRFVLLECSVSITDGSFSWDMNPDKAVLERYLIFLDSLTKEKEEEDRQDQTGRQTDRYLEGNRQRDVSTSNSFFQAVACLICGGLVDG